jgi:iron(III) transport system ATP-binding protein
MTEPLPRLPLLRVAAVHKAQGGRAVLRGVDLAVEAGSVVALLGASGCGKTTLLRIIAGFTGADRGQVVLDGRVVDGPGADVPAERRHIGYVPQDGSLFPHLTVRGNIGFGLDRAARRGPRIGEMLRLTGLDGLEDRMPHQLSGGQQQRTALARALAPRPRLVLLDEPFNALDRALRLSVCADVVALLRASEATAILVTHDPQEAFASADRIAVMRHGVVAQYADAITLYRQPVDAEVARLTGATLFLDGMMVDGQADTALGRLSVQPGAPPSGPVSVLLRPEQIGVAGETGGVAVLPRASVFEGARLNITVEVAGRLLTVHLPGTTELGDSLRLQVTGKVVAFAPDS